MGNYNKSDVDHYTILTSNRHSLIPKSHRETHHGYEWEVSDSFDCYGNDLRSFSVPAHAVQRDAQHDACAKACLEDPLCVAFNFPRGGRWLEDMRGERVCYLKYGDQALNIPSRNIRCKYGTFTPNWEYFTKDPCHGLAWDHSNEAKAWEPLDMSGHGLKVTADAHECKQRCESIEGCAHWTFWRLGRRCHIEDSFALPSSHRFGFSGGGKHCARPGGEAPLKSPTGELEHYTSLTPELGCVDIGAFRLPTLFGKFPRRMQVNSMLDKHTREIIGIQMCRDHCKNISDSMYFSIHFPDSTCTCSGEGSTRLYPLFMSVSGPVNCPTHTSFTSVVAKYLAGVGLRSSNRASHTVKGTSNQLIRPGSRPLSADKLLAGTGVLFLTGGLLAFIAGQWQRVAAGQSAGSTPAEKDGLLDDNEGVLGIRLGIRQG